jgi:dipeptidyl aminopeptidase/acylaminoacyl peptidase
MNHQHGLERTLDDWLTETAQPRVPDYLDSLLAQTARSRQRPAWSFAARWLPMTALTQATTSLRPAPWRGLALLVVLAVILAAGAAIIVGSQPRLPQPFGPAVNGRVVFSADGDIVLVDPVTADRTAIVGGPSLDMDPEWSLDGTRIAFVRVTGSATSVMTVRQDGQELATVATYPRGSVVSYEFSPDGRSVLILTAGGYDRDLFLGAVDGTSARRMDVGMQVVAAAFRPPDGAEIALVGGPTSGPLGLYVVSRDGDALRTLLEPVASMAIDHLAWAPDGSRIAYTSWDTNALGLTARLHLVSADGSSNREAPLPEDAVWQGGNVAWSSSGSSIVAVRGYESDRDRTVLAIMPADLGGTGIETDPSVPVNDDCCARPQWAPDDTVILVTPAGFLGKLEQQLLVDPQTGATRPAPWGASSQPAWQRLAP